MKSQTYVAFDYGSRKIGVAVGQSKLATTQGLTTISSKSSKLDWPSIDGIIQTWQPAGLVVGLPLNLDSSEGPMVGEARGFARKLRKRYFLRVFLVDERLSSDEANAILRHSAASGSHCNRRRRSSLRDQLAAELILRTFFSSPVGHSNRVS